MDLNEITNIAYFAMQPHYRQMMMFGIGAAVGASPITSKPEYFTNAYSPPKEDVKKDVVNSAVISGFTWLAAEIPATAHYGIESASVGTAVVDFVLLDFGFSAGRGIKNFIRHTYRNTFCKEEVFRDMMESVRGLFDESGPKKSNMKYLVSLKRNND